MQVRLDCASWYSPRNSYAAAYIGALCESWLDRLPIPRTHRPLALLMAIGGLTFWACCGGCLIFVGMLRYTTSRHMDVSAVDRLQKIKELPPEVAAEVERIVPAEKWHGSNEPAERAQAARTLEKIRKETRDIAMDAAMLIAAMAADKTGRLTATERSSGFSNRKRKDIVGAAAKLAPSMIEHDLGAGPCREKSAMSGSDSGAILSSGNRRVG